ncbi:hypothetical protein VTN49DRAFT_4873 [Thermomyces lanuginosus]|uniref:uncharacterized protein n=1 Tax=Thermomyces lanuginosus TaxID=5541 RepID=UPI003744B107
MNPFPGQCTPYSTYSKALNLWTIFEQFLTLMGIISRQTNIVNMDSSILIHHSTIVALPWLVSEPFMKTLLSCEKRGMKSKRNKCRKS